jgi:hypothetical protein
MRKITEDRFDLICSITPGVRVEQRDGKEVVVIRQYDFASDIIREITVGELVRDEAKPKFMPGDVVNPGQPNEAHIVDPLERFISDRVVKRNKPDGESEPA